MIHTLDFILRRLEAIGQHSACVRSLLSYRDTNAKNWKHELGTQTSRNHFDFANEGAKNDITSKGPHSLNIYAQTVTQNWQTRNPEIVKETISATHGWPMFLDKWIDLTRSWKHVLNLPNRDIFKANIRFYKVELLLILRACVWMPLIRWRSVKTLLAQPRCQKSTVGLLSSIEMREPTVANWSFEWLRKSWADYYFRPDLGAWFVKWSTCTLMPMVCAACMQKEGQPPKDSLDPHH